MRTQDAGGSSKVNYLLSDHLGSTSITMDEDGNKVAELRYTPWGEARYTWGIQVTDYKFTGQRNENTFGLYFYQSRFYDPSLGRFTQPDSIVPGAGNPMVLDRYAYGYNKKKKSRIRRFFSKS